MIVKLLLILIILLGLPLLGVWMSGRLLGPYLEFPPLTRYVDHAPFSWPVFWGMAGFVFVCVSPFVWRMIRWKNSESSVSSSAPELSNRTLPPWVWPGVALVTAGWIMAWNRFPWFAWGQRYTFTPLWLGYILIINALTFKRTGRCLVHNHKRYLLLLFPASSAFWWFFEYLNRFVQNWYYLGVMDYGPLQYMLHATVSFSTVLPAVASTAELLRSFPRMSDSTRCMKSWTVAHPKTASWALLVISGTGLACIGKWSDYVYPLLWVSPVLIIMALQVIFGETTVFSGIKQGDWSVVWVPAVSALICGLFWELWNFKSLAHWEYSVPFVGRFHVFSMPILGFAGYLPFGLECMMVAEIVRTMCYNTSPLAPE